MKDYSWMPSDERVRCWMDGINGISGCWLDGKEYRWPFGAGPWPENGMIDAAWVRKHGTQLAKISTPARSAIMDEYLHAGP